MIKEHVWRCFYEDSFFIDVRRKIKPRSSPISHEAKLVRVEKVEDPSTAETLPEIWEKITNEVKAYAQEMSYEHKPYSTIDAKDAAVHELYQSWEYANRIENPLLNVRCFYLQSWLHYGRDGGYSSCIPHVSIISSLVQKAIHPQWRDTRQEMFDRILAIASFQSSEIHEIADWVISALGQAHPTYGRQHITDVCIVQLMKVLRREDQREGNILVTGILTELWNALFVEEKR